MNPVPPAGRRRLSPLDRAVIALDRGLRTLAAPALSSRPHPDVSMENPDLEDPERQLSAALMRVNHTGEVCAQALYQGQAMTARDEDTRQLLEEAAREETDHLAWTERRIEELGGRTSLLNPLWYGGAFAIGLVAARLGDRMSLGFMAETERQVEAHLDSHLTELPQGDTRSRAIVEHMKYDEIKHRLSAEHRGAAPLPKPLRTLMGLMANVMTGTAYKI
jgi:ubiquinone biosynthesis monooxygenase Coq7